MFIEFGSSIISTSCIASIIKGYNPGDSFNGEWYYIRIVFNRKVKENLDCKLTFDTEEELMEKWNELRAILCPQKQVLTFDGDIKIEKDSPFFVPSDPNISSV